MHFFLSFQRVYEILKAWSFQKDDFGYKKTTKRRLCRLKYVPVKHTAVHIQPLVWSLQKVFGKAFRKSLDIPQKILIDSSDIPQ